MTKMYLTCGCGNYALLITDGEGHWITIDESWFPVKLDAYDEDDRLDDEANAQIIRDAIKSGEMYDADDFFDEYSNDERCYTPGYDGFTTLDEIDKAENYVEDIDSGDVHPRGYDVTSWIEI